MPYVMNALDRPVTVKVFSKHFEFKPKQIKAIVNDAIASKMEQSCGEEGLVSFPEEAMEWDRQSQEWKDLLSNKILEGRAKRLRKLEWIKYNEEISLARDLKSKDMNESPFTYGNPALVAAFTEYLELRTITKAESFNYEEKLKELAGKINNGDVSVTDNRAVSSGSPVVSQTTKAGK